MEFLGKPLSASAQGNTEKRIERLARRLFRLGAPHSVDLEGRKAFLRRQQAEMLREADIEEEE